SVVRADVEDREQVGMIDCACRARLLLEATQPIGVLSEHRRQDLDGDLARDARIAGAIDLPHPARPEGRDDFVMTNAGAGGEDQGCELYVRLVIPSVARDLGGVSRAPHAQVPRYARDDIVPLPHFDVTSQISASEVRSSR